MKSPHHNSYAGLRQVHCMPTNGVAWKTGFAFLLLGLSRVVVRQSSSRGKLQACIERTNEKRSSLTACRSRRRRNLLRAAAHTKQATRWCLPRSALYYYTTPPRRASSLVHVRSYCSLHALASLEARRRPVCCLHVSA